MVTSVNWVGNKNPRWDSLTGLGKKKLSQYVFPGPKRAEGKAGKLSVFFFADKNQMRCFKDHQV